MKKLYPLSIALVYLMGCAGQKIVDQKPTLEKLGNYKHVAIDVLPNKVGDEQLNTVFSSMVFKRLYTSKLFASVSYLKDASPNADLIIRAEIRKAKLPEADPSFIKVDMGGKVQMDTHYTIVAKQSNKILGELAIASNDGWKATGPGFQDTDTGYAFGRSSDQLVRYIERNK